MQMILLCTLVEKAICVQEANLDGVLRVEYWLYNI